MSYKVGKKVAGNLLDGQAWRQMPEVSIAELDGLNGDL
jgi:hypothetical protein